jgi:hypothetical protein
MAAKTRAPTDLASRTKAAAIGATAAVALEGALREVLEQRGKKISPVAAMSMRLVLGALPVIMAYLATDE